MASCRCSTNRSPDRDDRRRRPGDDLVQTFTPPSCAACSGSTPCSASSKPSTCAATSSCRRHSRRRCRRRARERFRGASDAANPRARPPPPQQVRRRRRRRDTRRRAHAVALNPAPLEARRRRRCVAIDALLNIGVFDPSRHRPSRPATWRSGTPRARRLEIDVRCARRRSATLRRRHACARTGRERARKTVDSPAFNRWMHAAVAARRIARLARAHKGNCSPRRATTRCAARSRMYLRPRRRRRWERRRAAEQVACSPRASTWTRRRDAKRRCAAVSGE